MNTTISPLYSCHYKPLLCLIFKFVQNKILNVAFFFFNGVCRTFSNILENATHPKLTSKRIILLRGFQEHEQWS